MHTIRQDSLPIPLALAAFTLALPPIAGLSLESTTALSSRDPTKGRCFRTNTSFLVAMIVLCVYETAIATLAGTHIAPVGGLRCGLEEQWAGLFHARKAKRIRRIQDAFQCCGLLGVKDRAFPFPDKEHGNDACVKVYGWQKSCLESWRAEERMVATLLLLVPLLVFLWKVDQIQMSEQITVLTTHKIIIISAPSERPLWLSRLLRLPQTNRDAEQGSQRRALEYRSVGEPYSDNPVTEEAEEEVLEENRAVRGNSQLASRVQPSALLGEAHEWSGQTAHE
ncbi:hypothetical protein B0A49_05548 [Cryomyces minteri]|uniref:Uncharacterized protein n=1 Tax=Cryomyces minteri TaxID=331657 RepID=A0A4V6WKZ8_9PEZI|nr:hypothetical protein B0A49_05548 [Cryomyces minteri]